jgi:succinoglycan biosynthesis protein ExoL
MLRCRKSLSFLQELVRNSNGRINVLLAGKPSPAELPDLESEVAATPGMRFVGSYGPDDLAELYGQCHFAWTIDWFEEGLNSSWLLPNRLYEAIAFGAVPIALSNIEVGRWLRQHQSGLTVESPEDVFARLEEMQETELLALQTAVRDVDRREVLCGREDCAALVSQLESVAIN